MARTTRGRLRGRETRKDIRQTLEPYSALLFVCFSSISAACSNSLFKSLNSMTLNEVVLVRTVSAFVFNLPVMVQTVTKKIYDIRIIPYLILLGVLFQICIYLQYSALKLMPIADVSVVISTTGLWTMVLSRIILKENFDVLNTVTAVLSMAALILMSRIFSLVYSTPSETYSDASYWYGFALALCVTILCGFLLVILRGLKDVQQSWIIAYQAAIGVVGGTISSLIFDDVDFPPCGFDRAKVLLIGGLSFLEAVLFTLATKYDKAGAVVNVRVASDVIFMFISQVVVFNEQPDVYSILAAIVVVISLGVSALRKYRQNKRKQRTEVNRRDTGEVQETEV